MVCFIIPVLQFVTVTPELSSIRDKSYCQCAFYFPPQVQTLPSNVVM